MGLTCVYIYIQSYLYMYIYIFIFSYITHILAMFSHCFACVDWPIVFARLHKLWPSTLPPCWRRKGRDCDYEFMYIYIYIRFTFLRKCMCVCAWMNGWMDDWMNVWMDVWLIDCFFIYIYIYIYLFGNIASIGSSNSRRHAAGSASHWITIWTVS